MILAAVGLSCNTKYIIVVAITVWGVVSALGRAMKGRG